MFNEKPFTRGTGPVDDATLRMVLAVGEILTTQKVKLATSVKAVIVATDTVKTIVAADATTQEVLLVNDATTIAYVKLGTGATSADWNFVLGPGETFPLPWRYVGVITAIWEAAVTGNIVVTILKE